MNGLGIQADYRVLTNWKLLQKLLYCYVSRYRITIPSKNTSVHIESGE